MSEKHRRIAGPIIFPAALVLLSFLAAGCADLPRSLQVSPRGAALLDGRPFKGTLIRGVPFYPQKPEFCGPASLAMVLDFWGRHLTQEEIAPQVYSPTVHGSLTLDVENYARKQGFWTHSYRGNLKDLKKDLDRGFPVIVFENRGFDSLPINHYSVIIGYSDDSGGVVMNSAEDRNYFMPYPLFLRNWKKGGYWTLLILPPDVARREGLGK